MAEDNNLEQTGPASKGRRDFVKTSAQVAVTAPAVAMLLSASTKSALAGGGAAYNASIHHILDDFTFGNSNEDIDAIEMKSNFNSRNASPEQDDHV